MDYYIFQGVTVAVALVRVVFIISDIIASAITGALERKQLNEAIDTLTEINNNVAKPLQEATEKISGVTQSIKDGMYMLDSEHLLVKFPDGYYRIKSKCKSSSSL